MAQSLKSFKYTTTGASRIGRGAEGEPNRANEGGDREVSEKLLEHEAIAGFPVPGRGRASPFVGRRSRSGGQG
jgi:hypothetical protein